MMTALFERVVPAEVSAAVRPRVRRRRLSSLHAQLVQAAPGAGYGSRSAGVRLVIADTATRVKYSGLGREIECRPGQVVVVPAGRSCRWEFDDRTQFSVLSVPADRLTGLGGAYPSADPNLLPLTALNRAAAGFLEQFVADVVNGYGAVDDRVEHIVVDLVRSMLEGSAGEASGSCPAELHSAVLAVIDRDFADPMLSVGQIADALAISRRQLFRYYEGNRETVSELIAARRLTHARTLLRTRPLMDLSTVAAESGFASASTLRRRFALRFGMTPRDYRAACYAADPAEVSEPGPPRPIPARPVSNAFEAI